MNSGLVSRGTLVFCAIAALGGCAATRREPPPEVLPQPPAITAAEAVARAPENARGSRGGPSGRSIEELRNQFTASPAPLDFWERLDYTHDRIYTWTQGRVEALDRRYAAKDGPLKPVPAAPFRLGVVAEALNRSDGVDMGLDLDLDITLRLPNIEDRLRIFVTSNELDEGPRNVNDDSSVRAGLRYNFMDFLDFDVGAKLDVPPVAFASLRWTRQVPLGSWDFYPLVKLFAETDESVGYTAAATFDRWSGRHLIRSSTFLKWRDDRDKTEWSQTFFYARANQLIVPDRYGSYVKGDDLGHGWGMRAEARGKETRQVDEYEAGVFYRRPAARNSWLFWYVEPMVQWNRDYNWNADPGIRFGIHALFWDLARPAAR